MPEQEPQLLFDDPRDIEVLFVAAPEKGSRESRRHLLRRHREWSIGHVASKHLLEHPQDKFELEGNDARVALECVRWAQQRIAAGDDSFLSSRLHDRPAVIVAYAEDRLT